MRFLILPILALCLFLAGCAFSTGGVDRDELNAQLKAGAEKVAKMEAFILANKPLVDQLGKLAVETQDPALMAAATKLRATVEAAMAALPTAQQELAALRTTVGNLEADAAGKVPWYTVIGGALLWLAPRVIGAAFPPLKPAAEVAAEWAWTAMATRRQKAADPGSKPAGD